MSDPVNASSKEPRLMNWLRRLPHYLYVVDLVAERRVLEFGCGEGDGAFFLANSGAAQVVGVDPDPDVIAAAEARHRLENLTFRREDLASVELEDASFDCIFVPEGLEVLRSEKVLLELRRLLAPNGHLVLSALSADRRLAAGIGASYYEFQDRLSELFAPVRMVAQSAFVGMSLVEYGEDGAPEPELDLDTTLAELGNGVEVSEYVAVCGGGEMALRGFTVVQIPSGEGVDALAALVGSELSERAREAEGKAQRALEHVRDLEAEAQLRRRGPVAGDDAQKRMQALALAQKRAAEEVERLKEQVEEAQLETGRAIAEGGLELGKARGEIAALRQRALELEADLAQRMSTASLPSPTERIADAVTAHLAEMKAMEDALDERQAFADELGDDLREAAERGELAERQRADAEARADKLGEELASWRTRASRLEGELLRLRGGASGDDTLEEEREVTDEREAAEEIERVEQVRHRVEELMRRVETAEARAQRAEAEAQELRDRLAAADGAGAGAGDADGELARAAKERREAESAQRLADAALQQAEELARQARAEAEAAERRHREQIERARAEVEEARQRGEELLGQARVEAEEARRRSEELLGQARVEAEEARRQSADSLRQVQAQAAEAQRREEIAQKEQREVEAALRRNEEVGRQAAEAQRRADAALQQAEEEWRKARAARQAIEDHAVSFSAPPPQSAKVAKPAVPAAELESLNRRVDQLSRRLGDATSLIEELHGGIAAVRDEAQASARERAPSVWAAQREEALRNLAADIGIRDAELTLLTAGVASLRQRLTEVATAVGEVRSRLTDSAPEEVRRALDRLGERLQGLVS